MTRSAQNIPERHARFRQVQDLTDWQAFLSERGAIWRDGELDRFEPQSGSDAQACIAPLLRTEILQCEGDGAVKLLQGQLTCDVSALSEQACSLGACCTPKGRMVANFRLFRTGTGFRFHLPDGQGRQLQDALSRYLPFYKCELTGVTDWRGIGCWGADAPAVLREAGFHVPDAINQVCASDEGFIARVHGVQPRFEIWLPGNAAGALWDRLQPAARANGTQAWALEDIRAGLGWITPELSEALVPQMLNLQHLDAISFKKGCYTGQEIVARMQYRGTLKKATLRYACADPDAGAPPGTAVCAALGESAIGEVVQSAGDGAHLELLAVVRLAEAAHERLHLGAPDGPALTRLELPYSLNTD